MPVSGKIIPFPGAPYLEVIFRLRHGVATTLVLPHAALDGARVGTKVKVTLEDAAFEAEILAMRPVWEQ